MGYGDELMGSGIAKDYMRRYRRRTAFGTDGRVRWSPQAHEIFRNNPNVVKPDEDVPENVIWVPHYQGNRLYHRGRTETRWIYNPQFRAKLGEIFFDTREMAMRAPLGIVIVEPNVKAVAPNKQWPFEYYQQITHELKRRGYEIGQFRGSRLLDGAAILETRTFREAVAMMRSARLFIGPEGGLHHGAAAVGLKAVVIFGGFTPIDQTGYDIHYNVFAGDEPCGSLRPCAHCVETMKSIPMDFVLNCALEMMK